MSTARADHPYRTGFSLVEAAVVLGVVGLVIGGIWVAASSVIFNHRLNELTAVAFSAEKQIRNSFSVGTKPTTNVYTSEATPYAYKIGAIPASWPVDPTSSSFYLHPFGGRIKIGINGTTDPKQMTIGFFSLSRDECIQVANKLSIIARSSPSDVLYILMGDDGGTTSSYSISGTPAYQQASAICPSNGNGFVNVYFKL